jgi:hypothetical protein
MRRVLYQRYGELGLGEADPQPRPVIGSIYVAGGFVIPALLGAEIRFAPDAAPQPLPVHLKPEQIDGLEKPDFRQTWPMIELIAQMDILEAEWGYLTGDLNTDGLLNAAYHLYGADLFADFYNAPQRVQRLLEMIAGLIVDVSEYVRQRTGSCSIAVNRMVERINPYLFLHANCSVPMISPRSYRDIQLPIEQQMAGRIQPFGVHHCGDTPVHTPSFPWLSSMLAGAPMWLPVARPCRRLSSTCDSARCACSPAPRRRSLRIQSRCCSPLVHWNWPGCVVSTWIMGHLTIICLRCTK